jgi:hypothetical protein
MGDGASVESPPYPRATGCELYPETSLLIAILYPDRIPKIKVKARKLALVAAVGVHEPKLLAAAAVRDKDNLCAVGGPTGVLVPLPTVLGQLGSRPLAFARYPNFIILCLIGDKGHLLRRG